MTARVTRPKPRRTALKGNRQHWTRRLDRFRVKFDLSERDFKEVLGGIFGKSQMHDVLSGKKKPRCEDLVKTVIAARLRLWLRDIQKLQSLSIESEILAIFGESERENLEVESVITEKTRMTPEAIKYFNLRRDPFAGDVESVDKIFVTPYLEKIIAQLEDAINYQHFVVVIGDIGSGKRNITRLLARSCEESDGKMVLIWPEFPNMEVVDSGAICSVVMEEFGHTAPHGRVRRARKVKQILASKASQGVRVALGFDECHRLDRRLLVALKNFYEMGSGGFERYLGLILLGQPKFRDTLNDPEFREIAERIDVIDLGYDGKKVSGKKVPNLGGLSWDYVAHRLKLVGGAADRLIDREVVTQLARIPGGNTPQGIGNLCNAAFNQAAEIGERKVHKGVLKSHSQINRALETIEGVKVRAARNV